MSGWSKSFKTTRSGLQRGQSTTWGEAYHCELSANVSQGNLSIFQLPVIQLFIERCHAGTHTIWISISPHWKACKNSA